MKLGIMQPYFMPYIGYWQLMAAVDKYVVYDDVNYIKGGWVSRNNILLNGEKHLFTIILKGASPNKLFDEVEIGDDFKKFRKMLESAYKKAPYYDQVMFILEDIFNYEQRDLGHFMMHQFQCVLNYLDIHTELILSSTLKKDNSLRGKEKVKHICHLLGADTYYNAIGGQELYDKADFKNEGINLSFIETKQVEYKQFSNPFISGLSMIDVLMFNSPQQVRTLLNAYNLI
ncbi:MAG: WbqC family protein [Paludibacteraceae bacterium]|nr:WbqC family protein [Paludibacteraceae bacterium]